MRRGGRAPVRHHPPAVAAPVAECPSAAPLLKTPTSQLAVNGGSQHPDKRREGGHGPTLADEVEHLVPGAVHYTEPAAAEPAAAVDEEGLLPAPLPVPARGACRPRPPSPGEARWGRYAPAIARWERALGRAAPAATDARGRLSTVFVEWMMGLAPGWVTAVPGLTRAAQLKALGNGVVPQQAAGAVRLLLARAHRT
ncbi:DNA (cytosine-5-)-methyltransferase [Streptomyces griseus]|uniref:DNA (cytosine-5-)-methyltransferase n=1 Tax=Streptomyces griseus TaxID=1911 RepID=UPI0037B53F1A